MTGRQKEIKRHLSPEELDEAIDEAQSAGEAHLVRRLECMKDLYAGDTLEEAAWRSGVDQGTVSRWSDAWNEDGVDGLRPDFDGGPKPKLSLEDKARLAELLEADEPWTYPAINELLREEFDVEYSETHLKRILQELGLNYARPRPTEYRRPDDATEQLQDALDEGFENLAQADSTPDGEHADADTGDDPDADPDLAPDGGREIVIGFFDETYPKPADIYHRVWAFGTPELPVTIDRFDANTFGFYALNGESVVEIKDRSRSQEICEFLRTIREHNPVRPILIVLDRYSSHLAADVAELADELDIELVFLPPKSPDLNPIEQLIGKLKYELSRTFVTEEAAFQELICDTFKELSNRLSFAKGWIDQFLDIPKLQKLS